MQPSPWRGERPRPLERSLLPARSSYFVFVNAVFRILWVGVSCIFACLYFWGTFAPHTSQVLEAGEMWEGARSSTKRVGVSMKFLRRAADNARCGLVRLRRTTMQSKILDPACAPKMKAKWKMEMVDIAWIRKGEWTLSGCFPYKRIARAQLFSWIKHLNICTCCYLRSCIFSVWNDENFQRW